MTDIRAELEAIKPAVDHGGRGHVHLGMGRPLSFEQEQMRLAKFRSMTPSADALDVIDRLGLRERLIQILTEAREHTGRMGSKGFHHSHGGR